MTFQISIFVTIASLALSLASFYLWHKLSKSYEWAARRKKWTAVLFASFILLQVTGPFLYRVSAIPLHRPLFVQWITYILLGLFACLFFFTLVTDIALFLSKRLFESPPDLRRRAFLGVSLVSTSTAAIGSAQALSGPEVYEVNVPIKNLPDALVGFKIAQISDLHVGPIIDKKYTERVVLLTNALTPDMIALTGDFVDGEVNSLKDQVAPLEGLKAKHGTFYITGNHEYYWGGEKWIQEFQNMGHRPLINTHEIINIGTAQLAVIGIPDQSKKRAQTQAGPDLIKAMKDVPADSIKILLAHQPVGYDEANEQGVHLQLSGHTHAGQFFPWNLVVALVYRYYKGLNRHKDMWLYVNRGTGFWGPPLRFAIPAEITLLTLKKES